MCKQNIYELRGVKILIYSPSHVEGRVAFSGSIVPIRTPMTSTPTWLLQRIKRLYDFRSPYPAAFPLQGEKRGSKELPHGYWPQWRRLLAGTFGNHAELTVMEIPPPCYCHHTSLEFFWEKFSISWSWLKCIEYENKRGIIEFLCLVHDGINRFMYFCDSAVIKARFVYFHLISARCLSYTLSHSLISPLLKILTDDPNLQFSFAFELTTQPLSVNFLLDLLIIIFLDK